MSKIIEAVKIASKQMKPKVDRAISNLLESALLHCEEIDLILSIDFNSLEDPKDKLIAKMAAQEALRDAKETLADMKKIARAAERLDRIIHGRQERVL